MKVLPSRSLSDTVNVIMFPKGVMDKVEDVFGAASEADLSSMSESLQVVLQDIKHVMTYSSKSQYGYGIVSSQVLSRCLAKSLQRDFRAIYSSDLSVVFTMYLNEQCSSTDVEFYRRKDFVFQILIKRGYTENVLTSVYQVFIEQGVFSGSDVQNCINAVVERRNVRVLKINEEQQKMKVINDQWPQYSCLFFWNKV